jgi:hypothetical protein
VDEIDGCFTFEEYRIHSTAILCQKLGLCGIIPTSALVVMSKQKTYKLINDFIHSFAKQLYNIGRMSLIIFDFIFYEIVLDKMFHVTISMAFVHSIYKYHLKYH